MLRRARTGGYSERRWAQRPAGPVPSAGRFAGRRTEERAASANHEAPCFLIAQAVATGGALVVWWFVGTKGYMSSRHRYGGRCLRGPHIGSGWHRSTNIIFDCGPNPRRAFWGASAQARGTDDPAAVWTVLNVEALLRDKEHGCEC